MANVQKFTRAATGHLCAHFERAKGEDGEYIRFGNQAIDPGKTPLNYNLAPDRKGGQVEFIRQRTSEVKCLKRADVNVLCSWVVTLPQGFTREKEFFEEAYKFLEERYKRENVVSAFVHMDEKQPHMHFSFVPVVAGKDGKEKVSAKELLTKLELQRFHPALQAALESALGQEVPVLNGATIGGNRTVAEMKAEQEIMAFAEQTNKAQNTLETVKEDVRDLQSQKNALQSDVEALQAKILTRREVLSLKGTKTLTGALKGVTYDEYENLRHTAMRVDTVEAEKNKVLARAESAEKKAADLAQENNGLKREVGRLRELLNRVLDFLKKRFPEVMKKLDAYVLDPDSINSKMERARDVAAERTATRQPLPGKEKDRGRER